MKKLYTIILTIATLALFFTACTVEEKHKPGEPDVDGCYGVYFPAQEESISLDPSDPTVAIINVARTNTSGAITVPFTLSGNTDIVTASEITFDDGQSETTCTLTFDNAEVGVAYKVSFVIEDEQYASKYGTMPVAFDYSITRDKWNSLGMASFFDTWMFGRAYEAELIQNDKDKNLYRLIDPLSEGLQAEGYVPDYYRRGPSDYIEFRVLKKGDKIAGQTISQDGLVYFKSFYTGYFNTTYNAEVMEYHPSAFTKYPDESGWLYNKVLQYQENGLPAGIQLAPFVYMDGVGGWDKTQLDGMTLIVFPGAVLTDYTIELAAGVSDKGVLPVEFTLGTDVKVAKYAIYAGSLNSAQIEQRVAAIADGSQTGTKSVAASGVENVTLDSTGVFTLVAVTFDDENGAQESASVAFGYVADGDEVPVVISGGLNVTDKYKPLGYTSENSLEFYTFGKGVTAARIGLYNHLDVLTDREAVIDDLLDSDPIAQEDLDSLNSNGYSDLFVRLSPGTKYDLLIWASNGFEEKIISASATTNGDPLPIYMNWTSADIDVELLPDNAEGYYGTYNYYGVDVYGTLGVREPLGTVTVEASTRPTEGPDADGLYDEFVTVKGVFGAAAEEYGIVDSLTFDCYNGVIYTLLNDLPVSPEGYYGHVTFGITSTGNWGYDYDYLIFGGYVMDGHIAFVCSPSYASYGFNGIGLFFYGDAAHTNGLGWAAKIADLMLVDPKKDISDAPAKVPSNSTMDRIVNEVNNSKNYVLTRDANVKVAIDRAINKVSMRGVKAGVDVVVDLPAVSFEATTTPLVKKSIDKNAPIEVAK